MSRRGLSLPILLLALAAGLGCGDDEAAKGTPTPPELTVPQERGTDDTTDDTTPEQSSPPPTSTGEQPSAPSPPPAAAPRGQAEDSPQNDIPPKPGTPKDRFERFCEANPGACG